MREESYRKQLQTEKELLVKVVENGVQFAVNIDRAISNKKEELTLVEDEYRTESLTTSDARYIKRRTLHFNDLKQLYSALSKS